jgi:hypothetical protein
MENLMEKITLRIATADADQELLDDVALEIAGTLGPAPHAGTGAKIKRPDCYSPSAN